SSAICARWVSRWGSSTSSPARSSAPATTPGNRFRPRASDGLHRVIPMTPTASSRAKRGTDPKLNLELLRSMLLQRRFEERCAEAYALGKIGGFCHLYIGQEAVSTGTLSM